ncbi:hypothetical protein [Roseisolibacter agri]|uniref:Uncharacterized protein n=1 Tax=Roseisolibacter agri TaxID=2014610 RepID=A0AA37Q1X1_9BACT|nr:hypothetical protein [Roseisolibacter agri]GLC24864.1 hypothetical protein rosag_13770 [Roseisolibacter agri]
MDEWLPAVLGCTWGLLAAARPGATPRLARREHRRRPSAHLVLALGVLAIGLLVPLVNGELAVSVWFVAMDTISAAAGAAIGVVARRLQSAPLARPAPRRRIG